MLAKFDDRMVKALVKSMLYGDRLKKLRFLIPSPYPSMMLRAVLAIVLACGAERLIGAYF
jgi:hypothetical protein